MKTAQVVNLSWADEGTVYKGSGKYIGAGKWKITSEGTFDENSFTAISGGTSGGGLHYVNSAVAPKAGSEPISSMLPFKASGAWASTTPCLEISGGTLRAYVAEASLADFKANYADLFGVYELESPTTFTVTGPDPETLLGLNNIFCDIAPLDITYRVNPADVASKIPGAPSADGTYTLKVTVSGGVATYSWVSA